MDKTGRSGFFLVRFLVAFAFCISCALLALAAFALDRGGIAADERHGATASRSSEPDINGVPIFEAAPVEQPDESTVDEASPAIPLQPSGEIDLAALGVHPLPFPLVPKSWENGGPNSAV